MSFLSIIGILGKLLNTVLNWFREESLMNAGEARGAAKGLAETEKRGSDGDKIVADVVAKSDADVDKELSS